jgi:O-succinylhomoserine sulfhydrylase
MKAHSASALTMAQYLAAHQQVERVYYAGLPEHTGHALAAKQQSAFGGVLSFEIKGDKAACWRFINATRLMSLTANLGDAKTTIVHPATTTHGRLSPEDKLAAGIKDNLIRVAVGLEDIDDLIADLNRGFAAI